MTGKTLEDFLRVIEEALEIGKKHARIDEACVDVKCFDVALAALSSLRLLLESEAEAELNKAKREVLENVIRESKRIEAKLRLERPSPTFVTMESYIREQLATLSREAGRG